jgi:hypothetical protein
MRFYESLSWYLCHCLSMLRISESNLASNAGLETLSSEFDGRASQPNCAVRSADTSRLITRQSESEWIAGSRHNGEACILRPGRSCQKNTNATICLDSRGGSPPGPRLFDAPMASQVGQERGGTLRCPLAPHGRGNERHRQRNESSGRVDRRDEG